MLMDFIFGKPAESQLNERSQALNNLLLDQIMNYYQQGPNMLPTYTAMAPDLAYSAPNTLLSSLGMEQVSRPDLPTTEIDGRTVYSTESLQKAMEDAFRAANPDYKTPQERAAEAARAAAAASAARYSASDNDDGGPSHAEIMQMHYGITPNSLTTGKPSAASQSVFSQADLMGNHGGSYVSKIASDVGNALKSGGIMGAISKAFSGGKDDDPSIGNVP